MFSIDSSSIKYLEYSSSIATTISSIVDLSNGGTISASIVSASALYAPSALADSYTPSLLGSIAENHTIDGIDEIDYPFTASGAAATVNRFKTFYVPANTIKPGDIIYFDFGLRRSGSTGTTTIRLNVNSGSSTIGTQLGTWGQNIEAGVTSRYFGVVSNTTLVVHAAATTNLQSNFNLSNTTLNNTITIPNLTGSTYWNVSVATGVLTTQSFYTTAFRILRG